MVLNYTETKYGDHVFFETMTFFPGGMGGLQNMMKQFQGAQMGGGGGGSGGSKSRKK